MKSTHRFWRAVREKDARYDGRFLFGVRTTGIYCRPSCGARTPKKTNVEFFAEARQARAAGYRACRRCTPDGVSPEQRQHALVQRSCRRIESADRAPNLRELAAEAGLSPYHFQRVFKKVMGVTPKQFQQAHRSLQLGKRLDDSASVTDAIYAAGFGSPSRFYSMASRTLGMSPSVYRRGGKGERIAYATQRCALGHVLMAATDKGICSIIFGDSGAEALRQLRSQFPHAALELDPEALTPALDMLMAHLEAPASELNLPLDLRGTAFQLRVWRELRNIPPGETLSYTELARRIGRPKAVRAVASACAGNNLAVAVPCHRIVRSDGALGGYRWDMRRKKALLKKESEGQ